MRPVELDGLVAELQHLRKLWPVSTCSTPNGIGAGQNALAARCSMTTESLPPKKHDGRGECGRDLTNDVNRLGLERLELAQRS